MFSTHTLIRSLTALLIPATLSRAIDVLELKSPCEIACALRIGSEMRMAGMGAGDEYVRAISSCSSQCDFEAGRAEQAPNLDLEDPCVNECVMSTGADMVKAGGNLGYEYWHAMGLCPGLCREQVRDEL